MSQLRNLIAVGFDQDSGEADFAITGTVTNLSHESMTELRAMIVIAVGTMEDMWRRAQEKKHPSVAALPERKKI